MIDFYANAVEAFSQKYTDDFIVHQIFFEESDPEAGGQSWNFSRSLGEDDDGVCTVKEIQQAVVYDGILKFQISRVRLACEFDGETARKTGTDRILIRYDLSDETWESVCALAKLVFSDKPYFSISEAA